MLCSISRRRFISSQEKETLPWLQNNGKVYCAVPISHFTSAIVDNSEKVFSFSCSDLNHNVSLSQFCLSTRLSLLTSSKWNTIRCSLESKVDWFLQQQFTQLVKPWCLIFIFHVAAGCIWHYSLKQSLYKTTATSCKNTVTLMLKCVWSWNWLARLTHSPFTPAWGKTGSW